MKLYTYYRSSAAFRVRIALNLKGMEHELVPVHLVRDGGEQKQADYLAKNPQGLLPLLQLDDKYLSQSLAILEYLDEVHPNPKLLPDDPLVKAQVRSIAQIIATDIHPINNLRVLQYLSGEFKASKEQKNTWYRHWIQHGFEALETILNQQVSINANKQNQFCIGSSPTIADCCLIPQVYNAERFNLPMHHYPRIQEINACCLELSAFDQALPENQADAPT